IPSSMEVWWIGKDGSIQDAYYDGGSWNRFQLASPGSASSTGDITAVSRIPSSMEIWWIGGDSSVQDGFWYDPNNPTPTTLTKYSGPVSTDQPLGGWANLVVSADGYVTFTGHMHDSGFDNIDYDLVGVLALPSGLAFTVHHHGHCEGTISWTPWHSPDR